METTAKHESDSPAPALPNEGNGSAVVYNSESSTEKPCPHPPICMQCDGEYYIQPDGPDAGKLFACGIMLENIEAGCMSFACPYSRTTPPNTMTSVGDKLICKTDKHLCLCQPEEGNSTCGKIIDADTEQAAIQDTIFADRKPFDPAKFVEDVIGS